MNDAGRSSLAGATVPGTAGEGRDALASVLGRHRPDAVAVQQGARVLRYSALEREANQLARHLVARGVIPGARVALCLPRSPERIVAMLAVLKAGGACVPLEPDVPAAPALRVLEAAGAAVLITDASGRRRLSAWRRGACIAVPGDAVPVEGEDDAPPAVAMAPDSVAWLCADAGAGAGPRGVSVTRAGLARRARNAELLEVGVDDAVLQLAPVTCAASLIETWAALLSGARLVLAPPGAPSAAALARVLREERISVAWLPAPYYHAMVDQHLDALHGVRRLLVSTGPLAASYVRRHISGLRPGAALVHAYAPDPTAPFECARRFERHDEPGATVPVGAALAHACVRLLDPQRRPVPEGVAGELYVGTVDDGWRPWPDGQAEFVPDPLAGAGAPRSSLWRTGDLARGLPDGSYELLGRVDRRFYSGGHAVEPEAIEACLAELPEVRQALVVTRAAGPETAVHAYLVPSDGAELDPAAAIEHLRRRLPEHALPAEIRTIAALPLLANGKLDEQALPVVASSRALTPWPRLPGRRDEAPRDSRELTLADDVSAALQALGARLAVPFESLLLAGYAKALAVMCGQPEVTLALAPDACHERPLAARAPALLTLSTSVRSWAELARAAARAEGSLLPGPASLTSVASAPGAALRRVDPPSDPPGASADGEVATSDGAFAVELQVALADDVRSTRAWLVFDGRVVAHEQGAAFAELLGRVLRAMSADPEAACDAAPVSAADAERLTAWNATSRAYPRTSLAHEFLEAARTGAASTALVELAADGSVRATLTYAELAARAAALARRLGDLGVGPDMPVGLCVERSCDMVVGLLGIVLAGGAYVPLDAGYPPERLEFMLQDSGIGVLVAQQALLGKLPAYALSLLSTVTLDDERWRGPADARGDGLVSPAVGPEHLAYVTYTSGSTGVPKGVAVPQRGVLRLVKGADFLDIGERDVFLQLAPVTFDASTLELWGALLNGARLVLAPPGAPDPDALGAVLREQHVSVAWLTAPLFHLMVDARADDLRRVRQVLAGGDVLLPAQVRKYVDGLADGHWLVNGYGPTENTTFTACHRMRELPDELGSVPIGRPIANTRVHVLDARLDPVPVGTPGELLVAGDGLARGYWARPELTAERFIPDPWGGPGTRLYRSGDLARWLPDGTLEFLGRLDAQVKVRGFRIEPGEVESALLRHPAVREAVVTARGEAGDKRLIAYVVASDGPAPTQAELHAFLRAHLPEYLVPAAFVELAALPLTPSGKVDRQALPAPDEGRLGPSTGYVAPRTPVERTLAEVWSEVLGVPRVGLHDNFFDLGGDSILSLHVRAEAEQRGLEFPLHELLARPTVAELAELVESLAQPAAGETRTAPFELVTPEVRAALPEDVEDAYPLSRLQAGMLFHSEYAPDSPIYHDIFHCHFEAPFDPAAWEQVVADAVRRHPVLRTSFDLGAPGEPLQLVHRGARVPIETLDLRGLPPSEQQARLTEWLAQEQARGFDWRRAPLLRVFFHRLSDTRVRCTFSFHHAILDGWSLATLTTELGRGYAARLRGESTASAPPAATLRDYVALEREAVGSAESWSFWEQALADHTVTRLPRLPGTAPASERSIRRVEVSLSERTADGLRRLAEAEGVPLKSLFVAAYARALAVIAGERDVVLGLLLNGRPEREDARELLGLFLNTLPLRLRLRGGTWRELARQAFDAERAIVPHRRFPMPEIKSRLGGETLFEAAFNFTHFHVYEQLDEAAGVKLGERGGFEESNFALVLQTGVLPGAERPHAVVEADTTVLTQAQADAIAEICEHVLAAMASAPDAHYDAVPLLLAAERQVLAASDGPATLTGEAPALAEAFARRAALAPDAPALTGAGESLTYAELDRRSNRLARALRARGVGRGLLVALCVERSVDLFVAVLGILKAGGAYLPLDPDYPQERLAFMLEDSGATALVTQDALLERLPAYPLALMSVLCLDSEREQVAAQSDAALELQARPDDLAYVIYTSGSTGRPKGVAVPQRGLYNLALEQGRIFGVGPGERVLQFASLSFDASAAEWIVALLNGAALVLVGRETALDAARMRAFLNDQRVSVATLPPSYLPALDPQGLPHLRALVVAGEACPPETAVAWGVGRRFFNAYGPTEASVCASIHAWDGAPVADSVPIGVPLGHVRVYVLDAALEPAPLGTPGELYVGGVGVARGYWERPGLTAERFVPDPFSSEPGARLYRTGDIVRRLPDGPLLFLGRADHQVKVRGFRIETGEVESALRRHPGVSEALVVGREARLVAYVVARADTTAPAPAELQAFLHEQLPDHMVPGAVVVLDALPLGPNGKVDRRRLPAPADAAGHARSFEPPATPTERVLAEIWSDVLEVPRVGRHDDYFDLGGDSILSIQVRAQAQARGFDLVLQDLFRHSTLAQLAAAVDAGRVAEGEGARPEPFGLITAEMRAALPEDVEDAYPLSLLQEGMLFHLRYDPEAGLYHDIMNYELRGRVDAELLQRAVDALVARHPILRTSFELERFDAPLQLVHRAAPLPVRVHDLTGLAPDERARVLAEAERAERLRRFDLRRASLLGLDLYREETELSQLTLTCPHAILDGWSVATMMSELLWHYAALLRGEAVASPPLRAHFRDFIALELRARASQESAAYWDTHVEGAEPTRVARLGAPAPANVACVSVPLTPEQEAGLRALSARFSVPLKSVLLALHLKALSVLSGSDDVITGVISNGRPESEDGQAILGLFLNALPFRLRLPHGTWDDLARATFALEQERLPHRRFPMPEIKRRAGGDDLFETVYNFTHFHAYERLDEQSEVALSIRGGLEYTNFILVMQAMVMPGTERIRLQLDLDEARLDAEDRRRVAAVYASVIAAVLQAPDACHDTRDCRPADERRLVAGWNATAPEGDLERTVHALFDEQARLRPDAPAVVTPDATLSYAQLERHANRLARRLLALGVGPDAPVALCLDRTAERAVGVLGVLKAGGAFVPLDPEQPEERLRFMLEDCGARVLVTRSTLLARVPSGAARALLLDEEAAALARLPERAPASGARADHLAYVIYTSGSTGRPKGVGVPHRGMVNMAEDQRGSLALGEGDVVLQFASPSFDASVWEMVTAWTAGAALALPPRAALVDRDAFAATLARYGVTAALLPPSFLSQFAPEELPGLRTLIVGGEACPHALAERFRVGRRLFNFYGPTEASVYATRARLDLRLGTSVPIGAPIGNARVHVLDRALVPAPIGVPGELYIGGAGLARGYVLRPDLTSAAFVPDPFAPWPGARLYRTGDLARWRPDGQVEYLGRVDQQLKVRGFRIEPGEVEEALRRHARVRDAAVVAHGEGAERRLVAYVEVPDGAPPSVGELRAHLQTSLPEHMRPSLFECLAELPRTASGKVDRRRLPAPGRTGVTRVPTATRTPTETALAELWAAVLDVERVGADDDFFELGGHSLLATQLVSRVRRVLGVELTLRALFEQPRLRDLARMLDAAQRSGPEPALVRVGAAEAPLSFSQQRLWFLEQLRPGTPTYNFPQAWRLDGRLDAQALARALGRIVERHEVLRTRYVPGEGETLQRVEPASFELRRADLSATPGPERERAWREHLDREALRPFDLRAEAPLRADLLRLSESEHVLFVCAHHIAWDGWSMGVFFRELEALYSAFTHGAPDPLPELPVQYADYARWQREWLRGPVLERQLEFWKARLAGSSGVLALPTDRARPPVKGHHGARLSVSVTGEVRDALVALARREDATLYMVLLAAFEALLGRWSGQSDVLVGTPTAGRGRDETEGLIGFFNNLLVMRADLSGDPSFAELLGRVREATLEAFAHQELPFEQLVEHVQPVRDTSRTPLCQVSFALQNFGHSEDLELDLPGLRARAETPRFDVARFDLTLNLIESARGLEGGIEYDADLFEPSTIARLGEHFVSLLGELARRAHEPLSRLDVTPAAERRLVLEEWNDTARAYPRDSIAAEFVRQAELHAGAPAVVELDAAGEAREELSYAELDRRANRLARHLRALGVGPDTLVGLCVERSLDLVVGMLGILKAGGAYVPFDPAYPQERLEFMFEDSAVGVLVAHEALLQRLPAYALGLVRTVSLDAERALIERHDDGPLEPPRDAERLAYVIYTSGSTGRPKGVMVPQRGVLRLVKNSDFARLDARDVFLHLAPASFDASTFEIWGALLNGARLVLAPREAPDPQLLRRILRAQRVSVLWLTAPLFHLMAGERDGALAQVEQVLAGGDVLLPGRVRAHLDTLPEGHWLINGYGPTENTTFTACHRMRALDPRAASVPLGRPIANTRAYVLDAALEPVPVGVPGELYAAGDGLARGYWARPELTAERFVPDPFGAPGERLYRTGDRVRWRADGTLEFLGRLDQQVKVRGFRIETGEVESALLKHSDVRETVVVARGEGTDKRLVAYVVPSEGARPATGELQAFLKARLPEYMVPSVFVALEALPLTPSGKVDRRALPSPDEAALGAGGRHVEPRTPLERALCAIWADVLGLERVGLEDNYFELGGDSILSIQIKAQAQAQGLDFALQDLFEHQTVRALAAAITGGAVEVEERLETAPFSLVAADVVAALPEDVEDAYPLSALQAGLLFHGELEAGSGVYHDIIEYVLRLPYDEPALRAALDELARCHPILRTSFDLTSFAEPVQRVHRAVSVPFACDDLRALEPSARATALAEALEREKHHDFEWGRAPLLRVQVRRLTDDTFQLGLSFHHAILDGWSEATLVTELLNRYEARRQGRALDARPLPTHYRDYVALERRALASSAEREYWERRLADAEATRLPRDPDAPGETPTERAFRPECACPPATLAALHAATREAGVPLKTLLLTAHLKVLSALTGQTDLVTGVLTHGRPETAAGERVLGLFLNPLPFRFRIEGGTWVELMRAVFRAEQEVTRYRRYPMAALQRRRGLAPLFDALFNFTQFHAYDETDSTRILSRGGYAASHFALLANFLLSPDSRSISIGFELSRDALSERRAGMVAALYQEVLERLAADPHARCENVSGLPADERRRVLHEWNDTRRERPAAATLHGLFAEQARRTPDAVALVCGPRSLSYAELRERSARLARVLRSRGVGPDVLVGVCLDRSVDLIVALLATLEAGGAYVPLDPAYPRERVAFMLRDSAARVVLTREHWASGLEGAGCDVLVLAGDAVRSAGVPLPPPAPQPPVVPEVERLAYVIYTSGSTGRPKGVAITHRSVVETVRWAQGTFGPAELERVLASTSVCFDLSIYEIFVPLASGGAVVLVDDLLALAREDGAAAPTLVNTVPSALAELIRQGCVPSSVRTINLAGEPLPASLVSAAYALGHVEKVYNLYGPSEDTTYSTWDWVRRDDPLAPSIGLPLDNTQAYLLDPWLEPLAEGAVGELYLGGWGLARGYLGRPELTAERFVPDPFGDPGARLYRTGDLARRRPDGRLEFLGRVDHQVKVRGFRIETGEIEEALRRDAGVREAVVLAREDQAGDKRLVAYFAGDGELAPAALRVALARSLPEHMLPSLFVRLAELPRLPNGKVDRKALPAPEPGGEVTRSLSAPRTPVEEALCAIFADVLALERVAPDENFFVLGGHSLLATQVVSRVRRVFDAELPLRRLFEHPTVRGLARWVEELRGAEPTPPLTRGGASEAPLSFSQQRLWFLEQLRPGTPVHNLPQAWRLEGPLDPDALAQALRRLVERHEVLRTRYVTRAGRTQQQVGPAGCELARADLSALDVAAREAAWRERVELAAARSFALDADGPLRAELIRLAPKEHVLFVCAHHIAWDGWSQGVFVRELSALYAAAARGVPDALPELPVQYADYARWQRDWLSGDVLERQLRYWREQLAGAATTLDLPTDRPRPAIKGHRGAHLPVVLPAAARDGAAALARREGATLYMVLLAAFQALLARWSGQTDVLVGSPTAGRGREETEGLIGFFNNLLVLRGDLSGDPTFLQLLGRVRETTLQAYVHQDLPFEQLVEHLQPVRDTSRTPLCQVSFVLQNFARIEGLTPELPGLRVSEAEFAFGVSRFDLTFNLIETAGGLAGGLEYDEELFERATAEGLVAAYAHLLTRWTARPDLALSRIEPATAAQRARVVEEWNPARRPASRGSLAAAFRAQAARRPEAVAVVELDAAGREARRLTYAELERRSNRLARHLRARGVRADAPVGLCVERSLDLAPALLGILKAGGAYVPLDPGYPAERLEFMLADVGVGVLVAHEALLAKLPAFALSLVQTVVLDEVGEALAALDDAPMLDDATPDRLAYVTYTSGSTGVPKGVAVTQRGVLRLVQGADFVEIADHDVFLQLAPVSFDASTLEIWGALLNGARLVLAPPGNPDLDALGQVLREQQVSVLWLTAPLYHLMVEQRLDDLRRVRQVLAGGDVLLPASVRRHLDDLPPGHWLINGYGPTENTTFTACHRTRALPAGAGSVPIGRPITGTRVYVLDQALQPVPPGMPGELYAGGEGVARGYWGRPELTAERFIPDPFAGEAGARLYRTGDRVRWRVDGTLEFLGRVDTQVKVRGFRIETGEVESVLRRHPSVREAAVVARGEGGDKRLVAYLVLAPGAETGTGDMQAYLEQHLPAYMVPTAFAALDALPLTPSGKLDRKALPDPGAGDLARRAGYEPPATPTESVLARIWTEVLGVPRVGRHDNYFELGGDSILSLQIKAQAEAEGVEFALQDLFEYQTVAALALAADEGRTERSDAFALEAASGMDLLSPADRRRLEGLDES